jgi:hypothetical protein
VAGQPIPETFAQAGPGLRLQLYPASDAGPGAEMVRWRLADGLDAVLVYELADGAPTVGPREAAAWRQPTDRLWWTGCDNVRAESNVRRGQARTEEGQELTVLEGESEYTATNVLWLDRLVSLDPARGAMVGVPNRHLVLVYPIRDRSFLAMVEVLARTVDHFHRAGPGSISPHLYWWRGGHLTHLPLRDSGGSVIFEPPDELADAVLSAGGK